MPEYKDVLIRVKDLSLELGSRLILSNIDLTVHRGEIVTVIGPNGAGKSSLLKCMLGLMTPTKGSIERGPITIGYTPQRLHLDPTMPLSVNRFLQLGQKKPVDCEKILDEVGVSGLGKQWVYKLSGGELQRVLLARALSHNPDLLVLDEPAQGVDLVGQNEVYQRLARIRDTRQCGILIVSHDLSLVMAQTDTVLCMNQHICCVGRPEVVARDPAFRAMFGVDAEYLALYAHRHDHVHSVEGDICTHKEEKPRD